MSEDQIADPGNQLRAERASQKIPLRRTRAIAIGRLSGAGL
jgi:hypothetical protein